MPACKGCVRWHVEAAPLTLSSREAFPLTLLLTELLSNSVLHGFHSREDGQVTIKAFSNANNVVIKITDNGQGLAQDFDLGRSSNLELGGRLTIGPNPDGTGTRTILTFPYQRPASPAPTEADRGREPAPVRMPA